MLDSASIAMIVGLVFCVIMSGYFSATETAFTSLNRVRLKSWADGGDQRAARTLALAEDYDKLLSTLLIGNNIVNNVATTIGAVLFIHLIDEVTGPTVSAIVLTVVILIFGEVSPKSLAKESPERFAMFATPLLGVLRTVLTPLNFLFTQWKRLLSKVFRKSADGGITEEELVTLVDQAESEGGLDQHESRLIRAAIEFHDLEVEEILTPRVDIVAVEDTDSMEEIAKIFAENGYSRLPVYHEDIDNIIGVIHEKDFHAARYRGLTSVKEMLGPMLYTTGNTKISELLRILQREKAHMVIVVDEYGGTEGLVTLEDIVEELVGEIWDEHDEVIEEFKRTAALPRRSWSLWWTRRRARAAWTSMRAALSGRPSSSTTWRWRRSSPPGWTSWRWRTPTPWRRSPRSSLRTGIPACRCTTRTSTTSSASSMRRISTRPATAA